MFISLNVLINILAATFFGAIIGLERELTNKFAGFRTNILVCLGSCIFTILSVHAFPLAADNLHPAAFGDPARIAAQILTGIGFIGGGTILKHGSSVYGLTTAATLWVCAAIGMACGVGMIGLAFVTTLVSILVLVIIRSFEPNLFGHNKYYQNYKVEIVCKKENYKKINDFIIEHTVNIKRFTKKQNKDDSDSINFSVVFKSNLDITEIEKSFSILEDVGALSIQYETI